MNISVKALVLRVRPAGESDRLCTLLTDSMGVINAYAKCARNIKNKNFTATAQFAYGRFELFFNHDRYSIDESQYEQLFVPLRDDVERLALAQYLCELCNELVPGHADAGVYLRVMLGALYYLAEKKRPCAAVRSAAELRMLSMAGYMPDLVMCSECGKYEDDRMLFLPDSGTIRCANCGADGARSVEMSRGALAAMRHIIWCDINRLYAFSLGEESTRQLAEAGERYMLTRMERGFPTLDFYHSILEADRLAAERKTSGGDEVQ